MQIALQERKVKMENEMISKLNLAIICISMLLGVIMLFAGFLFTSIEKRCKEKSNFGAFGAWCFLWRLCASCL